MLRDKEYLIGVVSLVLTALTFFGVTVTSITPSNNYFVVGFWVAGGMIVSSILTMFLRRLSANQRFPRKILSVETTLIVKLDELNGAIGCSKLKESTPTGYLTRKTKFKAKHNLNALERYYYVYDPCKPDLDYPNEFELDVQLVCSKGKETLIKSVNVEPSLSQFRKVILDISPTDKNTFHNYKEFTLVEQMRMSGNLDMDEEFYVWAINEPMKNSTFTMIFEDIEVEYVEHEVKTGIKSEKSRLLKEVSAGDGAKLQIFNFFTNRVKAGDKHIFRWRYKSPVWDVERADKITSTVL